VVFRSSGFERELPKRLLAPRFSNDFLPNFSMNRYESARWNNRFEFHHTALPIQLSPSRCEGKELLPFDRGGLDQTKSPQDSVGSRILVQTIGTLPATSSLTTVSRLIYPASKEPTKIARETRRSCEAFPLRLQQ